ncbi:hypothetical protein J6590_012519 [Homalodisca vitripennis]|nr:hypothetical protein J6590_012519 [Homalodisca vitripennis]
MEWKFPAKMTPSLGVLHLSPNTDVCGCVQNIRQTFIALTTRLTGLFKTEGESVHTNISILGHLLTSGWSCFITPRFGHQFVSRSAYSCMVMVVTFDTLLNPVSLPAQFRQYDQTSRVSSLTTYGSTHNLRATPGNKVKRKRGVDVSLAVSPPSRRAADVNHEIKSITARDLKRESTLHSCGRPEDGRQPTELPSATYGNPQARSLLDYYYVLLHVCGCTSCTVYRPNCPQQRTVTHRRARCWNTTTYTFTFMAVLRTPYRDRTALSNVR